MAEPLYWRLAEAEAAIEEVRNAYFPIELVQWHWPIGFSIGGLVIWRTFGGLGLAVRELFKNLRVPERTSEKRWVTKLQARRR